MKLTIIIVHLIFGFALIYIGIIHVILTSQIANRNDFSDYTIPVFPTEQIYVEKCMTAGGNSTPEKCRAEYSEIRKNGEQTRKEETGYVRENLFSIIMPLVLIILLGLISAISALGFWKFRKWGAIGLIISSVVTLVVSLYSFIFLLRFVTSPLFLAVPLAIIIWTIGESMYIKRTWKTSGTQDVI